MLFETCDWMLRVYARNTKSSSGSSACTCFAPQAASMLCAKQSISCFLTHCGAPGSGKLWHDVLQEFSWEQLDNDSNHPTWLLHVTCASSTSVCSLALFVMNLNVHLFVAAFGITKLMSSICMALWNVWYRQNFVVPVSVGQILPTLQKLGAPAGYWYSSTKDLAEHLCWNSWGPQDSQGLKNWTNHNKPKFTETYGSTQSSKVAECLWDFWHFVRLLARRVSSHRIIISLLLTWAFLGSWRQATLAAIFLEAILVAHRLHSKIRPTHSGEDVWQKWCCSTAQMGNRSTLVMVLLEERLQRWWSIESKSTRSQRNSRNLRTPGCEKWRWQQWASQRFKAAKYNEI